MGQEHGEAVMATWVPGRGWDGTPTEEEVWRRIAPTLIAVARRVAAEKAAADRLRIDRPSVPVET
jgi:hypothetical protein